MDSFEIKASEAQIVQSASRIKLALAGAALTLAAAVTGAVAAVALTSGGHAAAPQAPVTVLSPASAIEDAPSFTTPNEDAAPTAEPTTAPVVTSPASPVAPSAPVSDTEPAAPKKVTKVAANQDQQQGTSRSKDVSSDEIAPVTGNEPVAATQHPVKGNVDPVEDTTADTVAPTEKDNKDTLPAIGAEKASDTGPSDK